MTDGRLQYPQRFFKKRGDNNTATKTAQGGARGKILAHRISISEILPLDRKSYLTHAILPRTSSNVIL